MDYQEDKEQLENFQSQEISKVKHLVLLREQELAERTAALKDCNQQIEKLKGEINRLRRQEQLLSDVQVSYCLQKYLSFYSFLNILVLFLSSIHKNIHSFGNP